MPAPASVVPACAHVPSARRTSTVAVVASPFGRTLAVTVAVVGAVAVACAP